jgi:hypothetical protein
MARHLFVSALEISFSQGAEWKALINQYIAAMPLSGETCCAPAQSTSAESAPGKAVSNAMIAKVGAAARHSQVAPRAAVPRLTLLDSSASSLGQTNTALILRSGLLAASRRIGHKRLGPSFETPRKRAAPQDEG